MAIDTEDKRRSTLRILPVADGSIAGQDRVHIWIYRGLTIAAGAVRDRIAVTLNITRSVAQRLNIARSVSIRLER